MQLAYLAKAMTPANFETLVLAENIANANEVSMLKARTKLAFLYGEGRLMQTTFCENKWTAFYEKETTTAVDYEMLNGLPDDILAVIPTRNNENSAKQPGVIFVRNDAAIKAIMINSFFDSSKKWLQKNNSELNRLQAQL